MNKQLKRDLIEAIDINDIAYDIHSEWEEDIDDTSYFFVAEYGQINVYEVTDDGEIKNESLLTMNIELKITEEEEE